MKGSSPPQTVLIRSRRQEHVMPETNKDGRFTGKVAFVTGAASGIGRATAFAFAREGAAVAVADVSDKANQETAEAIEALGGRVLTVRCDVRRSEDVKAALDEVVDAFGGLDFAFNNAGVEQEPKPAADVSEEEWDRILGIDLRGVFLCMKHEIPLMLQRGGGAIVNTSSGAGVIGFAGGAAYGAAKHGVIGLTKVAALDEGLHGVGAVFLVWTAPPATAAAVVERLATHTQRVVFLSSPPQPPHPFFQQPNPMAVLHADIERLVAESGLESTIIRPGMFASNALFWWAPAIRADGVVRWPYGAAETAPVDERDVGEVAARALYQDGHAGGDYVLTGPESLSQAEQVSIIGDVLGRPVTFEELTPDEFRRETQGSWPGSVVDMLLDAWGATLGRPAYVTSTVSDILGRAPRSFRQSVADNAAAFMAGPTR